MTSLESGTWTELCAISALNLHLTLHSGQAFIWQQLPSGEWCGAIDGFPVLLRESENRVFVEVWLQCPERQIDRVRDYFQLSYDMEKMYARWQSSDEEFMNISSHRTFQGLRILRQDPVECLFSFVVSQNNNVKRISSILQEIRKFAGEKILQSPEIYAFPEIFRLGKISEAEYVKLGLGYRAKYFRSTAIALEELGGKDWLMSLRKHSQPDLSNVRELLMQFHGVGRKVADCVSLFSLDFSELVPCDTHVLAIAQKRLKKIPRKSPTLADHDEIQKYFVSVFGELAGWAHSILFVARLAEFRSAKVGSKSKAKIRDA